MKGSAVFICSLGLSDRTFQSDTNGADADVLISFSLSEQSVLMSIPNHDRFIDSCGLYCMRKDECCINPTKFCRTMEGKKDSNNAALPVSLPPMLIHSPTGTAFPKFRANLPDFRLRVNNQIVHKRLTKKLLTDSFFSKSRIKRA